MFEFRFKRGYLDEIIVIKLNFLFLFHGFRILKSKNLELSEKVRDLTN